MNTSKINSLIILSQIALILMTISACATSNNNNNNKEVTINIIETTDIHGNYFPYDFIKMKPSNGSLARVQTYLKEQRKEFGDNIVLLDNGDILQGQPTAYYYNFIETKQEHLAASILNYMGYSASSVGNHDVEAGPDVYYRWAEDYDFPVLAANIINNETGEPAFKPYTIIEKEGVKIAVLGMITPAIPSWLPEQLWKGLSFRDMQETAEEWLPIIYKKEKPDLVIGLFHAGQQGTILDGVKENPSMEIAKEVEGFDIVLMGHDHRRENITVANSAGDSVLVMNAECYGNYIASIEARFQLRKGKVVEKSLKGELINTNKYSPDEEYLDKFKNEYQAISNFVIEKIGYIDQTISSKDAYFGSSKFIDFIHSLQMRLTGADLSFCSPLSFVSEIKEGNITISDMFSLYKYENFLYTMSLSGQEIKDHLEYSYQKWVHQMQKPEDDFLVLDHPEDDNERAKFKYPLYNFDSAFGIIYTVDVTKPQGKKITIQSMADGTPFDLNKTYKVAINSYRGNGGGELLTKGAGIPKDQLAKRVITSTDKDMRYYIIQYIKENKNIQIQDYNHWSFIPEDLVQPAKKREYAKLF